MHKKVLVDLRMEGLLSKSIYHQTQLDMLKTFIFKQPYYYTSANDAKLCVVKTNKRLEDGFQKQKKSDKC